MSGLFVVAAVAKAGFYRCGKFFPHEGTIVDASNFAKEQWERIKNEAQLRVKPASKADKKAAKADTDAAEAADARKVQIIEIIKTLKPEDFDNGGKPKVAAINALLETDQDKVGSTERDEIWDALQKMTETAQD